jgi:AcrR family transcriptional regulator
MTMCIPARGGVSAGEKTDLRYPIEVVVHGRTLWTTRLMWKLFAKSARVNLESAGAPLTVLSHSGGVELLHITGSTPIAVRDVLMGGDLPLWDHVSQFAPVAGEPAAPLSPSSINWNGTTMNDLNDRIVAAAYPLFTHRPVHEVTLEQVRAAADVTATELEGEFPSLDALVEECLKRRERDWTIGLVRAGVEARTDEPGEQLLAIFDVFDEWFHRSDYEACTFVNVLLEMGKDHPLGRASVEHLTYIRGLVAGLAADAGLAQPEEFAYSWHILMKGAIINAVEGDGDAARRAQAMGRDLIARYRRIADEARDAEGHQLDPRWAVG